MWFTFLKNRNKTRFSCNKSAFLKNVKPSSHKQLNPPFLESEGNEGSDERSSCGETSNEDDSAPVV